MTDMLNDLNANLDFNKNKLNVSNLNSYRTDALKEV